MSGLTSWNYQWTESGGSSWEEYLRATDIVQTINSGTAHVARGLAACMTENTRQLLGGLSGIERSLHSGFGAMNSSLREMNNSVREVNDSVNRLGALFHWGTSQVLASMGGMQSTLDDLLKVAKTPTQTAAFEQFEIARDAFRKGLLPECLESLGQAIDGVAGVSSGYKLEWRFHHLQGLVLLGSHDNTDPATFNPAEAEKAFLKAARYAKADAPKDAAKAMLAAGWAAYVQPDGVRFDKLKSALEHTDNATALDPGLTEGYFQAAKIRMALGAVGSGFEALDMAIGGGGLGYAAKAAADGDFKRHEQALEEYLSATITKLLQLPTPAELLNITKSLLEEARAKTHTSDIQVREDPELIIFTLDTCHSYLKMLIKDGLCPDTRTHEVLLVHKLLEGVKDGLNPV